MTCQPGVPVRLEVRKPDRNVFIGLLHAGIPVTAARPSHWQSARCKALRELSPAWQVVGQCEGPTLAQATPGVPMMLPAGGAIGPTRPQPDRCW